MRDSILRFNDRLYLGCIWTAGLSVVAMAIIIPWGIFARYVLGTGSQWPEPISILLMVLFTFVGAAATYRTGGDIAVVMLTEKLPAVPKRVLAFLVDLTMAAICLFVVVYGASLCRETMGQTIAELPWLAVGYTYLPIPVGAFLTLVFVVERMLMGSQSHREVVRFGEGDVVDAAAEGAN